MKKSAILLGCLALVLAACGSAPSTATPTAEAVQAKNTNLATAAEGKLEPVQSVALNFTSGGLVIEVNVKEGQTVEAGDVIARLKSDAQRDALAEAEAALAVAKASQAAYRSQLPQLIAAAEAEVKAAQAQQAGAAAGRDRQAEIVEAEAALAQARYAQTQIETSMNIMRQYEQDSGENWQKLQLAYANAVKATQAADARVKALKAGSPGDRAATAQIDAAQAAEAAAQARLEQLIAERDGIAADSFEAAIQQAQAAIDSAQAALAQTELGAPLAGTIAQLNLKVGELTPREQPAAVLADLSGWQIETDDVSEIKVPSIKVGQPVTIRIDALPELTLKGEVESISSVAQLKSGDVIYPVKIKVLENDPRLRWGMTVAVAFGE
ncbi:MAG TPA: HlyD family efflux transporter periplasmic adaptor subunit [Anaerolineae bacterium]|nr:HlyD family efflux transporter periplasmic adaptor subunit [Anaerolineae bacterium]